MLIIAHLPKGTSENHTKQTGGQEITNLAKKKDKSHKSSLYK